MHGHMNVNLSQKCVLVTAAKHHWTVTGCVHNFRSDSSYYAALGTTHSRSATIGNDACQFFQSNSKNPKAYSQK